MFNRIKGIFLGAWYYRIHNLEAVVDAFWWAFTSIIIFGFISVYFSSQGVNTYTLIMGLLLWELVRSIQSSVAMSILREVWSRNLSSLFTAPISAFEFISAQILLSTLQSLVVMTFTGIIAAVFYNFSLLSLGWGLPLYIINLLLFAYAAGVAILGIIFRFGTRIQAFAWSLLVIFEPLLGIYYPITILPQSIQTFAKFFPVTYIFEAARTTYETGVIPLHLVWLAFSLNLVYLGGSILFFQKMFAYSKRSGTFARLES